MSTDVTELRIEGRNAVLEALRAGQSIERIYLQEGLRDGAIRTIRKLAKEAGVVFSEIPKERIDRLSEGGHHQGVVADLSAFSYSTVEEILSAAAKEAEDPFLVLLDGIEDPHNLGAILRTAHAAGAHGVILPKRRAAGLSATVMKTSAGALNYIPVARVTSLTDTIRKLKDEGLWFVCADMDGDPMTSLSLTGPIGVVIGGEGEGVSRLVKEQCDFRASIPMKGKIDSLNASVAAGILIYEIVRQRT